MGTANDKFYDATHDNLGMTLTKLSTKLATKIQRRQQLYCA